MSIKSILKKHRNLLNISAFIYSVFSYLKYVRYIINGNVKFKGAFLRKTTFKLHGKNIKVSIGSGSRISNCIFFCKGDNISITITGEKTRIENTFFYCEDNNSSIFIGRYLTMEGGHVASTEGEKITIGEDCMFSNDIEIRNGDSHTILNKDTEERINHAKSVKIGNHVWLCAHSRVLKGSQIPNNCIIGNSTIISGRLQDEYSIYTGIPAKKIKEGIVWCRPRK